MKARLTVLNGMLDREFELSIKKHRACGMECVDLKDSIYGKSVGELTREEAIRAQNLISDEKLSIYSLSSDICHYDIERGEELFREQAQGQVKKILAIASILGPYAVRLLSAWSSRRKEFDNSVTFIDNRHPWLYDIYRDCIDQFSSAGFAVFIENEGHNNLFSCTAEIQGFFKKLDREKHALLTWDVQNLWQMGTFPSVEVYEELKDLVGYLHLKGGIAGDKRDLAWASSLSEASWPVRDIVLRCLNGGRVSTICLNPSHGPRPGGYCPETVLKSDIAYINTILGAIK